MPFEDSIESMEALIASDDGHQQHPGTAADPPPAPATQHLPPPPKEDADSKTNTPPVDRSTEITVRVGVRVRPLIAREIAESCISCLQTRVVPAHPSQPLPTAAPTTTEATTALSSEPCPTEIEIGHGRRFTFNHVLPELFQQNDVWEQCHVQHMVDSCFDGYNATIFAYGQTGSGKTHTMGMGMEDNTNVPDAELGIVPRAINHIFTRLDAMKQAAAHGDVSGPTDEYLIRVSFVEILREKVQDLLIDAPHEPQYNRPSVPGEDEDDEEEEAALYEQQENVRGGRAGRAGKNYRTDKEKRVLKKKQQQQRRKRERLRRRADLFSHANGGGGGMGGPGGEEGVAIKIHEDKKGVVHVTGCRAVTVTSAEELHAQLYRVSAMVVSILLPGYQCSWCVQTD
jgi:hypothetical protein